MHIFKDGWANIASCGSSEFQSKMDELSLHSCCWGMFYVYQTTSYLKFYNKIIISSSLDIIAGQHAKTKYDMAGEWKLDLVHQQSIALLNYFNIR